MIYDQNYVNNYYQMMEDYNNDFVIQYFKEHIKQNSKVLELGSGTGADYLLLRSDYQYTASDFSQAFIDEFQARHLETMRKIDAQNLEINETFDCIYSSKVLNSLNYEQLVSSFKKQATILNNPGYVVHTMWCGDPNLDASFYSYDEILKLVTQDFKIIEILKYKEADFIDAEYDSVLIFAQKKWITFWNRSFITDDYRWLFNSVIH